MNAEIMPQIPPTNKPRHKIPIATKAAPIGAPPPELLDIKYAIKIAMPPMARRVPTKQPKILNLNQLATAYTFDCSAVFILTKSPADLKRM